MNLEQFAIAAGVEIIDCEAGWGGRIGYTEKDCPNSSVCGFRSKKQAYKRWLADAFGENTSKAIMQLLEP